jgi:large subunit ribosomal protein L4e
MLMDANVYALDGKLSGKVELPGIFSKEFRGDIVRRALLSEQSSGYQPQGHDVLAGFNTTAVYVGKYSGYRHGRHMGTAIRPRQKLGGGAMGDVRQVPSSVKGHRAHPHKIEKKIEEYINKKEYAQAIVSAISGSAKPDLVLKRHSLDKKDVPFVVDDAIEHVSKSKELLKVLNALGLSKDLGRSHKPRLRKGLARRSSKRHFRNSVLIVAKDPSTVERAGRNIAGVDVCGIGSLAV